MTAQNFVASHAEGAMFARGLRSFFEYRDLGIKQATGGQVDAQAARQRSQVSPSSQVPSQRPSQRWARRSPPESVQCWARCWARVRHSGRARGRPTEPGQVGALPKVTSWGQPKEPAPARQARQERGAVRRGAAQTGHRARRRLRARSFAPPQEGSGCTQQR